MKLSEIILRLRDIQESLILRNIDPEVVIDPTQPGDCCQSIAEIRYVEGYDVEISSDEGPCYGD
jgi:hypothetical protein